MVYGYINNLDTKRLKLFCRDGVPEGDHTHGRVSGTRASVQKDHSLLEVTPDVVGSDVGEVDERIHGHGDAKGFTLPTERGDVGARHFEGPVDPAQRRVEAHLVGVTLRRRGYRIQSGSADGQNRAIMVPLGVHVAHPSVKDCGSCNRIGLG